MNWQIKQIEELREEYEYFDDYMENRDELGGMSLEEYDEARCIQDYGATEEELGCDDDDDDY